MKNVRSSSVALAVIGALAIALLGTSCSDEPGPALTMEFTGCDFSGATVAYVELFQGATQVAYGAAPLVGGAASFPLYDVDTGAVWLATLGVTYTGTAYCFDGSVGDPAPTSGYWRLNMTNYTQSQQSAYSEIDFRGSDFTYID